MLCPARASPINSSADTPPTAYPKVKIIMSDIHAPRLFSCCSSSVIVPGALYLRVKRALRMCKSLISVFGKHMLYIGAGAARRSRPRTSAEIFAGAAKPHRTPTFQNLFAQGKIL